MQKMARKLTWFAFSMLIGGTLAVAATPQPPTPAQTPTPESDCGVLMSVEPAAADDLEIAQPGATPAADSTNCCDPALEPGVNGNPFCFEGHTCCASGRWQCNNADGTPSCTVCGATCGLSGSSCNVNADCCSGQCKGNHKCR